MLRDITVGQYFPGNSIVHKMDPRTKIIVGLIYIFVLFIASNFFSLLLGVIFIFGTVILSGVSLTLLKKSIDPVIPLVGISLIFNIFFTDGDVLWKLGILKITDRGVWAAVFMCIRLICLVIGTYIFTYTTSIMQITHGLEQLLNPLNKINFPVQEIAMTMTIALRFIPTLIEEADKIISAQKSRGADMDSGSVIKRVKSRIPILIPLFMASFQRADELTLAMSCRCYDSGNPRTYLEKLEYKRYDFFAFFCIAIIGILVIYIDTRIPKVFY
ncbi:energy-coupling factor transporter transmembrane component T family protein [Clostridium sp. Marseille-P2415]|uniref:energy-coupling factor transporter transmembrane component T family protein n=1 Tax=Clostridium sp. Marseille-P2415 TaxID=1805471 RepID=UPI0009886C01|nr:energy-coupling factor transporter transmembrane component T [Clostridium sp. Marseille-P2415]